MDSHQDRPPMPTADRTTFALAVVIGLPLLALGGCANAPLPSLSTGSLFGGSANAGAAGAAAAPAKPALKNDPLARTLQVARVSARAQRCGFHFDPSKLKANFLGAEGREPGADVAALAKLDQTYTVTFNATLKVISAEESYCSDARIAHVKGDLTRHLAGDFGPSPAFEAPEEPGLVSFGGGLFGGGKSEE